ncbi:MAG: hypothetical protein K0U52_09065 [Gammaproteobacteria bacterium]|nr:hypothetical protein [Gammaproteobacteria bacterium]
MFTHNLTDGTCYIPSPTPSTTDTCGYAAFVVTVVDDHHDVDHHQEKQSDNGENKKRVTHWFYVLVIEFRCWLVLGGVG